MLGLLPIILVIRLTEDGMGPLKFFPGLESSLLVDNSNVSDGTLAVDAVSNWAP